MEKSNKLQADIDTLRKKRADIDAKIVALQKQKEQAINDEMLQMVKTITCDPNELKSILSALQGKDLDELRSLVEKKGGMGVQEPPVITQP